MFDNSSYLNPWEVEIVANFQHSTDKIRKP